MSCFLCAFESIIHACALCCSKVLAHAGIQSCNNELHLLSLFLSKATGFCVV